MARNADKKQQDVNVPHIRLVKNEAMAPEQVEFEKRQYKSQFARQMAQFSDDLDLQIELIKNS